MSSTISPNPTLSMNCRGRLLTLERPRIMGILNLTPDSFSDGGQYNQIDRALRRVEEMILEGADIIDIGGYSSRPFADDVSEAEELRRIESVTAHILQTFPEILISIDTFRSGVAKKMLEIGAHIVNDISGGGSDREMWPTIAQFGDVPYILMHMQGQPNTMQENPQYANVLAEVLEYLAQQAQAARQQGIKDIILDPGFGFGKTILHNYQLLGGIHHFTQLGLPVLVGISRKSMLYRLFETEAKDVLEVASALHLQVLQQGAHILRVHDVKAAKRIVDLHLYLAEHGII